MLFVGIVVGYVDDANGTTGLTVTCDGGNDVDSDGCNVVKSIAGTIGDGDGAADETNEGIALGLIIDITIGMVIVGISVGKLAGVRSDGPIGVGSSVGEVDKVKVGKFVGGDDVWILDGTTDGQGVGSIVK